jgi:hypothetical protein
VRAFEEIAMAANPLDRDRARGERAAEQVRAAGGSAMAAALAAIEATFSPAHKHSLRKRRVAALIREGAAHGQVRARYQRLAERYPDANLHTVIAIVTRLYLAECDARATAVRLWGRCSRPRLALMLLEDLRLVLRMVRRYAPTRYAALAAAVRETEDSAHHMSEAAE